MYRSGSPTRRSTTTMYAGNLYLSPLTQSLVRYSSVLSITNNDVELDLKKTSVICDVYSSLASNKCRLCLLIIQVAITPESISRARNRWIINELVNLHKEYLGGRLPVYDGKKGLFTAGPLPFKAKEFVLMLTNPERANLGYDATQ
jgi:hypothetical protein